MSIVFQNVHLQEKVFRHKKSPWIIHQLQMVPTCSSSVPLNKCVHVRPSRASLPSPTCPGRKANASSVEVLVNWEGQRAGKWRWEVTERFCLTWNHPLACSPETKVTISYLKGPSIKRGSMKRLDCWSQWSSTQDRAGPPLKLGCCLPVPGDAEQEKLGPSCSQPLQGTNSHKTQL